jgi:hypothetical protein
MLLLFFSLGGPEIIFLMVFFLFVAFLPLLALIDVLKSRFAGSDKIVWLLVVLLLPFLGALFSFPIGRKQKI